ncbi:BatA domain-containing protein [Hymenobacter psychrophilus]|uniref:N-terminal double-transmembrane domain-containing protein n=1 Tax=Hymenobacter psychrophilus TaxID=651662 RepID=A0A1H3IL09_9BACT|nr:BatA domain-containing protein [Hymenobacter psychrophilus]SDY28523.1 N-terminal double-transmembrane domain-containing protein [Hymenobacter psychrophilus]
MVFTYPWFLWGLLAVAIPIAIHLFELRRPQRVLFSNVEFIREVKLVTARQRKLKHLLVLAARIGLVAFLVLLFAQPFIPASEQAATGNVVQVLLDNSPSMRQLGSNDQPVLEQAIDQAVDLPLAFPVTARFGLSPGGPDLLNAAAFRSAAEKVQVSGQAGELGRALAQRQQQRSTAGFGPLFVFSDFQKNDFSARSLQLLDSTQQVFLVPATVRPTANVFIDSVWVDDGFVRSDSDLTLRIRLKNGGQVPAENCPAKLFVGPRQAASFQITVPAGQVVTTQVRLRLSGPQTQQCRVVVDDFPVDFDNTYFFTLQPAAQIRVVEAATSARLDRLYGNEPLFNYQFTNAQIADYRKLAEGNLLLLREAPTLTAGLRENLRRAVQQGATLVVVPPAAAGSYEAYTQLFRELGLGPVQWQPVPPTGPVLQEVAVPSNRNPFFRDVFAGINPKAAMPKAAPVLRWARTGTEVLGMRDGESFLAGFSSGAGMVYVFSAPFSTPYSDFAQHPLFVPVLYKLAMQSYRQTQQPAYRLNQAVATVQLPVRETGAEAVYRLVQDSLSFIPVHRRQGSVLRLEVPPGLRQPGFYELQQAGKTVATLAFNFDKRESDLAGYSAAELRALIGPNRPNVRVYETSGSQTAAAQYKATRVGTPLWQYCIWGALACLLLEALLLRWSRRPAPVTAVTA